MVTQRMRLLALAGMLAVVGAAPWAMRPAGFAFADLWLTPDQQGRWLVEHDDDALAGRRFRDPMWRGVACYRARDLECAMQSFARVSDADGDYNLGISQAHAGELEPALRSFERAVLARPAWRDARENRDLVARLIAAALVKGDEPGEPNDEADEVKADDEGKRGKRGTVEIEKLGPEAIDKLWLRNVRTDPAAFLRARFAAESSLRKSAEPAR
jgi:Ca-activated chloride channel homolog